ncbi:MAG: glucose-6-phosphate isomerase [Candidatus Saccharimonadales bacterium]|nr:glucose-6-phosphate isomerase [Candidatus Saccharimonadales bacterium]
MGAWEDLKEHHSQVRQVRLRDLFSNDPARQKNYSLTVGDLYLDYSKNRVTDETMDLLFTLAASVNLQAQIRDLFGGEKINVTENRAVLHPALRAPKAVKFEVNGRDVSEKVHRELKKMEEFSKTVRSGKWLGATGKPVKNIINIGIGGSDLGPRMAVNALRAYSYYDLNIDFISNIDGADFIEVTRGLDPEETLFIISTKSGTTDETMTNAATAKAWIADAIGEDRVGHHFVAVTANKKAIKEFGITPANIFEFWDWVGGRYSMTSAIGLPIITAIGLKHWRELLAGFYEMDRHFRTAPLGKNAPVILGLLGIWYNNFYGAQTEAVLPYSRYLHYLPAYLQQASMESNGKSVTKDGKRIVRHSAGVVWGRPGTDGQHSFHQMLHQGSMMVPADFIGFKKPIESLNDQHRKLMANMVAQTEALAFGRLDHEMKEDEVPIELVPHKRMPGNRPSNTILMPKLTPHALGMIIALYEHKIFVQGAIWRVNSFDQFGVELGKQLAKDVYDELGNKSKPDHDSSTNELIKRLR